MEQRHEFVGKAPIPMEPGKTYQVKLADVTILEKGWSAATPVSAVFRWDVSSAKEVPEPQLVQHDALVALEDLKKAGPGAICDACGHFGYRHHDKTCRFPRTESPCECPGFAWQGFRFTMHSRQGPIAAVEKVVSEPGSDRAELILSLVKDTVAKFLHYDRKEDEDLPRGAIEEAIRAGEITVEDIAGEFENEIMARLEELLK